MDNILLMQGVQPELRRAFGSLGSLAIPFGTPRNAAAAQVVLAKADLDLLAVGDVVSFDGNDFTMAAVPGDNEFANAAGLAALLNALDDWGAAENTGAITITAATRGAAYNGKVVTLTKLEDTTAGGNGAGTEATATIAAATIARLANGDTVAFAGEIFTKAALTDVAKNEFANAAGLSACIDAMTDWAAVEDTGAVDITAATDSTDFNDIDIVVTLYRTTASGVDGTPAFRGAVCADAGFIYVCTATDTTITNNNWERAAIAAF
jgi:hypothetical protein